MASSRPLYPSISWKYFLDWPWSRSIWQRRASRSSSVVTAPASPRPPAGLGDRLRGGDECERHRHHGVSGSNARRDQGEAQGVRAAGQSDAELRVAELREVALELPDHRATNEAGGVECSLENRSQF